ncbi:MAG: S9 family peptidase [Pseudomonadales bacterium]
MTTISPYGSWTSPISAEAVVAGVVGFAELRTLDECVYWLESRPQEHGRCVIVMRDATGQLRDLTPTPYNVRSRVHEYGGGAYLPTSAGIFFVNLSDQNVYRIDETGAIQQLTDSTADTRFCNLCEDPARNRLIAVAELHDAPDEPRNVLAAIDLGSGDVTILEAEYDFYANPIVCADGGQLAYIGWDHPNMPWDGTLLKTAKFSATGELIDSGTIAGGADESILQPVWLDNDKLLFISDSNGYWNLYRYDSSGLYCVLEDGADYAHAPWVFGLTDFVALDDAHVAIVRQTAQGQELLVINTATLMATPITGDGDPWVSFDYLCAHEGQLLFIGAFADRTTAIIAYDLQNHHAVTLHESPSPEITRENIASAEPLEFPTRDGRCAHAYFYPPQNATCRGADSERPPLLVMSHGGPTSSAGRSLNYKIQYYTSRGWAVLDVNYRGSTGFGRAYRKALDGHWGELDVTDCEDGVRFLSATNRIDPLRVAIRGGSAGGYTTLSALTTTHTFRAGASHYGIGDLTALAADTHKFESRYLGGLIGSEEAFITRSPIEHIDSLDCPVIFFQGGEDKVVPPNQALGMVNALREKGIPVAYLEFPEEGHGFRAAANIIRALEAEYAFFCRIFGITPADSLAAIEIENLDTIN